MYILLEDIKGNIIELVKFIISVCEFDFFLFLKFNNKNKILIIFKWNVRFCK